MSFSDKKSVLDEGGFLRTPIGEHNIPRSTLSNAVFVAYSAHPNCLRQLLLSAKRYPKMCDLNGHNLISSHHTFSKLPCMLL